MATSFSPYVTVYDKRTKMGHLVYRASLQSFLNSGNYTQEKPSGAKASDTLMQLLTSSHSISGQPEAIRSSAKFVSRMHDDTFNVESRRHVAASFSNPASVRPLQ